jgi:pimeloyl-ACP methyl ester carboxylesterase
MTRTRPDWKIAATHRDAVASMALGRITVPTLIVSHRKDGCEFTPSSDAAKLKDRLVKARKVEVVLLDGGSPPQSEPCEAKAQHGFLGIEWQAVDAIVAFVKANPK